jgi:hypothetical protein
MTPLNLTADTATAAVLFASTFAVVFCLGLQSQFVNNGHYKSAFCNSLAIGGSNLLILKNIPATPLQTAAYLTGGAFAIVLAMRAFRLWAAHKAHQAQLKTLYKGHVPPRPSPQPAPCDAYNPRRMINSNQPSAHKRPAPPPNPPRTGL